MKKIIVFLLCLTVSANFLFAQDIERNVKERLTDYFNKYTATAKISTPKLNSFDINMIARQLQSTHRKVSPISLSVRKL